MVDRFSSRGGPCGRPGFCFWCYRNRKRGPAFVGHWGLMSQRKVKPREIIVPIPPPVAGSTVTSSCTFDGCPILQQCPTLLEYLTDEKFSDGSKREVSTLSVFIEGDYLKMALNDRQNRRGLYLAGETVESIFLALEGSLAAGNPPWKNWPARGKGK